MAKTETLDSGVVARSWMPHLDSGTAIMTVLIGFMGFYVLYPLMLIVINMTLVETPLAIRWAQMMPENE